MYIEDTAASPTEKDIETCKLVANDLRSKNPSVLDAYPHLNDPKKFADIIKYTKTHRNIHTYVNQQGVNNVADLCLKAIRNEIPGAFVEVGTLRGGIGILMAGILKELSPDRQLYIFDSFEGLGSASESDSLFDREVWDKYRHWFSEHEFCCKCELSQVQKNFDAYGLGDIPNFVKGWIPDCFSGFDEKISCLRIDVDWYQPTKDSLVHLYQKVSPGGYVIIDDYKLRGCRTAMEEFFDHLGITPKLNFACEKTGIVYWEK